MRTAMHVVELRNLSREGTSLSNVDLELHPGQVLALSAAGGDGSRLARILSLDDDCWSGEFFFLGSAVHELGPAQRRELRRSEVGVIFHDERLVPELSVYENLEVPLTFRTRRSHRGALIEPLIEAFVLHDLVDAFPRSLSRRETQLVKIARAAVGSPSMVIAEDLSSCIRSADWPRVRAVLRRLISGGTVLALTRESDRRAVESDDADPLAVPEPTHSSSISAFAS